MTNPATSRMTAAAFFTDAMTASSGSVPDFCADHALNLGVQYDTLASWADGRRRPARAFHVALAQLLGVTPDTLRDVLRETDPTATVPAATSGNTRQQRNAAQCARSAAFITNAIDDLGLTVKEFSDTHRVALGRSAKAIIMWAAGDTRPAVQLLPQLAELLGVPLDALCDAVGKPPHAAIRDTFAADPAASLPGMLRAWQDAHNLTASEAAARCGFEQTGFSRYVSGSSRPGPYRLARIAAGTGIALTTLTAAAWPGDDDRSATLRALAAGLESRTGIMLRAALESAAMDVTQLAEWSGLPFATTTRLVGGVDTPTIDQCIALARALTINLRGLLLACDVHPDVAEQISVAAVAARRRPAVDGREVIETARTRPYVDPRGRVRKTVSWEHLGARIGKNRNAAYKAVMVHTAPLSAEHCIALADELDAPRDLLLAGFGHRA